MSIQQIPLSTGFHLPFVPPDIQPLAAYNTHGQTQPINQEEQTLNILNQTLAIVESQNSAIQAEYAAALQQAQSTLSELQKNQRQLLQHNSILAAQNIVLQSQYNQSEMIHQADQTATQELIDLLKQENDHLKKTMAIYEEAFSTLETVAQKPLEAVRSTHYNNINSTIALKNDIRKIYIPTWNAISHLLHTTKQQLLDLFIKK